ncbi:MAG: hypothetical protein ACOWWH_08970 [Eubacteriaceae bacterium]
MSQGIFINKSSKQVPIYDEPYGNMVQIGKIYVNECFGFGSGYAGDQVIFRNSAGNIATGYFKDDEGPVWDGNFKNIADYPYGYQTINSVSYKTFKMRRTEDIWNQSGSHWGAVAGGQYVAFSSDDSGDTHCDWKQIKYVKGTNGEWYRVGSNYGFVELGLNHGSMRYQVSLIGTF